MIKKITILALVLFSSATAFVCCSSDDNSPEEQQNSNYSYKINPPNWLLGKWEFHNSEDGSYGDCEFTSNDILYWSGASWSWEYKIATTSYDERRAHSANFYDKTHTSSYYEAEYILKYKSSDGEYVEIENIKVEKLSDTSIKVTYKQNGNGQVDDEITIRTYNKVK